MVNDTEQKKVSFNKTLSDYLFLNQSSLLDFFFFKENKILSVKCTSHMLFSIHCRYIAHNSTWIVHGIKAVHQHILTTCLMCHWYMRKLYVRSWTRILFPQLKRTIGSHLKYIEIKVKTAFHLEKLFHLEIRQQYVLIKAPEKGRKKKALSVNYIVFQ